MAALAMAAAVAIAQDAPMGPLRPDQVAYLSLYKELVETNTTLSAGSCTLATGRVAAHLKAAGFAGQDLTLFSVPEHPKDGGPARGGRFSTSAISTWSRPSVRTGAAILLP